MHYDNLVGGGALHPWHGFMRSLLVDSGVTDPAPLVDWLWSEQPARNLWRKPIAPMVALARELRAAGITVGVISNSEGRLAELLDEMAIADPFSTIVDSGRCGMEKPDPMIFAHALAELGVAADVPAIHIGDLWTADVVGALSSGWRAIWYGPHVTPVVDPRVATARDAAQARTALVDWDVLQ